MMRLGQRSLRRWYGAWKTDEDRLLKLAYEKHGPAWTVLSFDLHGRSPRECQKRHLQLSGLLGSSPLLKDPRAFHSIFHEGYDLAKDGTFVRFPVERVEENPIGKLAAGLPHRRRAGRRLAIDSLKENDDDCWSEREKLVVREGYEMWGPNWKLIAGKLQKRTPEQVQRLMEIMSAEILAES